MNHLFYKFLVFTILVTPLVVFGQTADSASAAQEARIWADVRKPYFKATVDDSLFVVNNSNFPFHYDYYTRAELAGFMEQMFFNARIGDIVGPLFLDGYAILYKVIEFDSTYRMKASQIFLKPEGNTAKDTANAVKKANKIVKEITKGLDFAEAAKKYGADEASKKGGDIGWFGEGLMVKEIETPVLNGKKGDIFVAKTPFGIHIVKITDDKVKEPHGRIKVIPLMKRIGEP
ncbi:peptidylprolyl isomerase [Xanthocytophaga agilis]|uniref:peptidylprolyl isomerase n=1 Tax=Xanthocytophaga agilis TaxID=3048010 RepID=A0AAE3RBA0_9BACT|nr:peptidylprolyl isomerase [Xanthocytophaga agilis]MDJ1506720.1 peptidylprolyl isomerase [Xanthocytophaga agilis]